MPPTLAGSGVTAFDQPPSHSERSVHRTTQSRVTRFDRWICRHVQSSIAPSRVRLELWDGSGAANAPSEPIGALLVRDRGTLIGLAANSDLWFGEGDMTSAPRGAKRCARSLRGAVAGGTARPVVAGTRVRCAGVCQHAQRLPAQRAAPPHLCNKSLRALAGPRAGLTLVRISRIARCRSKQPSGGEARSRLPEAAVETGLKPSVKRVAAGVPSRCKWPVTMVFASLRSMFRANNSTTRDRGPLARA